jgi:vancomycin permeability regulator SanA
MNLQEHIRRVLRETLETKWNEGNYDYQHGFCHYFAYDIIDRIRERFPNKKINYYLLLGEEINEDDNEVENEYLIHAYIQIDNMLLDSNGFTTKEKAQERLEEWEERQLTLIPEEYQLNVWEEESDDIPKHFFNSSFCNTKRVKQDIEKFLSHPMVKRILKYK